MVKVDISAPQAGALAVRYDQASAVFATSLRRTMREIERELVRALRASIRASIGRVSGRLANKVSGKLTLQDDTFALGVRSRAWYARGHELGAVRQPRRAAHLTVPLMGAENTRRGDLARWNDGTKKTSAFTARQVIESPGTYGFTGTFTRNGIIFGRLLDHDDVVPLFALRSSITLRPRRMHQDAREVMAPRVYALLGASVDEAVATMAAPGREVLA